MQDFFLFFCVCLGFLFSFGSLGLFVFPVSICITEGEKNNF